MNYKKLRTKNKELKADIKMYKELYKTVMQEYKHQGTKKMNFDDLICDIDKLLNKKIKHSLISAYLDNGRKKIILNDSIHYDEIVGI